MKKILLTIMLVLSSACYAGNSNLKTYIADIAENQQDVIEVVSQLTKQLEEGVIHKEDVLALIKEDAEFGFVAIAAMIVVGALVVGGGYLVYDVLVW